MPVQRPPAKRTTAEHNICEPVYFSERTPLSALQTAPEDREHQKYESPHEAIEAGGAGTDVVERRILRLLALHRAAVTITGELELDSLLQRIVDEARQLVGCKYAALGVLGEDGYIQRFPTSGISPEEREKIGSPPRGHGLLGVMLRAGRTLRIPDISKDPRRVGFPPHHPHMTSLLGVPIFVRGRLAGDLYLADKIGGPEFTEEDEWLVQLLATHAATALTNAELHAELTQALDRAERERARTQALLTVTQAVNRSVHLDEVIGLVLRSATQLLGAAGAAVFFLEQGGRRFVARHAIGLEKSLTTNAAELPVEGSVAGRVVRTGQTQVVNDTLLEPHTVFPRLAGKVLRSLVAVPLRAGGQGQQVIGVLGTYFDRPDAIGPENVDLMEAFAAVAGTALNNALAYEEARQGREAAEREQARLRELEQMKDEFLSTAAHELRTPLTTIRMASGLALDQIRRWAHLEELDERLVNLMALVVENSERMQALVNDLLDLTRLEQGRAPLSFERVDARDVVNEAIAQTAPMFDSKAQKLSVHLTEMACPVYGDRRRLEQVITNLLSNAHKYSPPGSPVEVRIMRSGDECLISVRDNGPGVPEGERELIFERFYRSSLHRTDRTSSTGLGLPIARRIAEMHGGRVWMEPAPGGGSIFTLSLPVSTPPPETPPTERAAPGRHRHESAKAKAKGAGKGNMRGAGDDSRRQVPQAVEDRHESMAVEQSGAG
jgi:signal transduction histidine kinase